MSDLRKNIVWLLQFYKPLRNRLVLIAFMSILVGALSASMPYIYIRIIDGINESISSDFLLRSILILLGLGVSNFLISATNASKRAQTNLDLEWGFRQSVFSKLIRMDQKFYERFRTGDMITRLTDDVGRKLSWFACSGIFRAWESSLRTIFCLSAMFMINPRLAAIALIPFPIQILIYVTSTQILDRRFKKLQSVISRVNDTIESCFSGIKIVQAYCMENREVLRFSQIADERAMAEVSAEKSHIFVHSMYGYFWQISQVVILLAGGMMVINDTLTVGQFVAFDYYIAFLVWPMFDIGGLLVGYRRAAVSIGRLRELDQYIPTIQPPPSAVTPLENDGRYISDRVTVMRGSKKTLNDVTFDIQSYRMVAVVGEIGSGKSTLLTLACRFLDPDRGCIRLDGVDLKDYDLSRLRQRIGFVSQEPLLFTDTVRNNIRFGREWISDQMVEWAADIAQLTHEVTSFDSGFDTPIGLRGMTVSGGQKQRISIARALAGKPDILILDDATAHLDAETEAALWTRLHEDLPGMRVIVVSHRTATLERVDLILVLKEGVLIEQGTHEELIANRSEYYRIYSRRKIEEYVRGNGIPAR